jgi:hypothetical protein
MKPPSIYHEIFRDVGKRTSHNVTNKRNNNEATMDLVEVCKRINVGDVEPPSELELTTEIQKLANAERRQDETSAAAFARVVSGDDERGLVLRKSLRACKRAAGFPV